MDNQPANQSMQCPLCGEFSAPNLSKLLPHIRLVHADTPAFEIECTLEGCCRKFKRFTTYRNHVYSLHDKALKGPMNKPIPVTSGSNDLAKNDELLDGSDEELQLATEAEESQELERDPDTEKHAIQRAAATWILKARECYRIPQSSMEAIVQDLDSLYECSLENIHDAVKRCLQQSGVDTHTLDQVTSIFVERRKLFVGLDTQYLQMKYFQCHFHVVMPHEIILGTERKPRGTGTKRRLIEKKEVMIYIPLLQTLECLLQNEVVQAEVQRGHQNENEVLKDYCDGNYFKRHHLFSIHLNGLQLILYYDDIEVCNPLGSKRTIHGLGMFYFLLGNISPAYRSKLRNINLLAVVKKSYIQKYSLNSILHPIVQDILKLEQGWTITLNGQQQKYYGAVSVLCADNPASSACGGFKKGGKAYRGCRQCMGTSEEMSTKFREQDFQLRTLECHLEHCEKIETDHSGEDYSKLYGVNERSVLMDLQYFDVCSGALLADIMHDLLEGALQYEAKLLLQYLTRTKRYLKAKQFHHLLEVYELGFMEVSDRPTPITRKTLCSEGNSLDQKAGQMWLLGCLLPAIIGYCVPDGDPYWENYLVMVQICKYLFSPSITEDEIGHLASLIQHHHEEFTLLYPENTVLPKMHNMVHMPRLISEFGPLVHHWTMRFEAKHNYFKKLASRLGNFINVAYTLAVRHQCLSCYYSLDKNSIGNDEIELGPGCTITSSEVPISIGVDSSSKVYRAKWTKVNGILYKKPCALLTGVCPDEAVPQFGKLEDIFVVQNHVHFLISTLKTEHFAEHFNAYVTSKVGTLELLIQENMEHPHPVHMRSIQGLTTHSERAIVLKYHISCM